MLGLHCCRLLLLEVSRGWSLVAVSGFLIAEESLVAEHGLQSVDSIRVVHGFSCSTARGIFPEQGSSPCPLHWQVDSQPLGHQGSPVPFFKGCALPPSLLFQNHWAPVWLNPVRGETLSLATQSLIMMSSPALCSEVGFLKWKRKGWSHNHRERITPCPHAASSLLQPP